MFQFEFSQLDIQKNRWALYIFYLIDKNRICGVMVSVLAWEKEQRLGDSE